MKVYLWPTFNKQDRGEGGIRRVWEALNKWLPEYGVTLVDKPDQADVVNVHADEYITDRPVAASLHGFYWKGYQWANWCYEANERLIRVAKQAQAVSTPSEWVANSVRRGMLIDPYVLMHGIEPDQWTPGENKGYVLWGKTRPDPICDPFPAEELARRCFPTNVVTTFSEIQLVNLKKTGRVTFEENQELIRCAGVYLGTVMETGGITCLEAMAAGVPVLGFDWGVNPEIIVHEETGYLVPPGNYEALLDGLHYCLDNRKRLGEAAREHVVKNFSWQDRVGAYIPFYESAIMANEVPVSVSVVVTAYNLEEYLPECLDSIIAQNFDDWECIIVNDASPDQCGAIAEEYAKRDSRFRVIHNTANAYLSEARNIGLRTARGKYVVCLDADDKLSSSALRILAGSLDKDKNLDIVTGGFELVEPDGRHWQSGWPESNPNFYDQLRKRNQVPYASMYRKWVWERTGGYRRRYRTAEDAAFWTYVMSFGARPAKVTDAPTLIYANRPGSMSHSVPMIDWAGWATWASQPELTPYAAAVHNPKFAQGVHSFNDPKLSVVIPCGPGHDFYLQDVLDSLIAQTFQEWEVIVVNDTGASWYEDGKLVNPYLQGYPFVRIVENDHNRGVAYSRNAGFEAAKTDLVVLFDADDYMQPLFLDVMYVVYQTHGGWVYCDWYKDEGEIQEAQSWSATRLTEKMLGPITGLYEKSAWEKVGGFDENAPGWEDWQFQLKLLSEGICGSRATLPLFTYRYKTGKRREENFSRAKEIIQYIQKSNAQLYKDKEFLMACRSCGGGGGQAAVNVGLSSSSPSANDEPMILVEYVGIPTQFRSLRSKVHPTRVYRYGGEKGNPERKFYIYAADSGWLLSFSDFRVVEVPSTTVSVPAMPVVLTAATPPAPVQEVDESVNNLALPKEVISILDRNGYRRVSHIKRLSLTDLVALKGMGPARARKVMDVVATYS